MYEHIDSWKNAEDAFRQQLQLNIKELTTQPPPHWEHFIEFLKMLIPITRVIDIGCGAGVYGYISNYVERDYIGYDYSPNAIELAKKSWKELSDVQLPGNTNTIDYYCKDYKELPEAENPDQDLLVANAICDVLPNGHECLKFLLGLKYRYLLIQRVSMIDKIEYYDEYQAYNITTYKYHHNKDKTIALIEDMGYNVSPVLLYEDTYDLEIIIND